MTIPVRKIIKSPILRRNVRMECIDLQEKNMNS